MALGRHLSIAFSTVAAVAAASTIASAQSDSALEREIEYLNSKIGEAPSRRHHDRADVLFRLGRFEEAIRDYDMAAKFGQPHDENSCWERGLARYYAGDFKAGAEQFERYHRVGPLDIENGLWRFLCIAETDGIVKARETMLEYARKVRPPFPALLDLYLGKGSKEAVLEEATNGEIEGEDLRTRMFNAEYYLGKYYDVTGAQEQALVCMRAASSIEIPHFMYACAQIDQKRIELGADSITEEE